MKSRDASASKNHFHSVLNNVKKGHFLVAKKEKKGAGARGAIWAMPKRKDVFVGWLPEVATESILPTNVGWVHLS